MILLAQSPKYDAPSEDRTHYFVIIVNQIGSLTIAPALRLPFKIAEFGTRTHL